MQKKKKKESHPITQTAPIVGWWNNSSENLEDIRALSLSRYCYLAVDDIFLRRPRPNISRRPLTSNNCTTPVFPLAFLVVAFEISAGILRRKIIHLRACATRSSRRFWYRHAVGKHIRDIAKASLFTYEIILEILLTWYHRRLQIAAIMENRNNYISNLWR